MPKLYWMAAAVTLALSVLPPAGDQSVYVAVDGPGSAGPLQQTSEKTVTFLFAPPHPTTFVETTRTEMEMQMPGQAPQRQITDQQATYLIERLAQGYLVSVKPMRPKDLVMSQEAEQASLDLLSRMDLKYELDSTGQLVRVHGVESGLRLLTQALGKEMMQVLLSSLGSKSLDDMAAKQWNNRGLLGAFAGQTLAIGQARSVTRPVPLPIGGSVSGNVTIAVQGPVPCGGSTCHSIKVNMKSDDPRIGVAATGFLNNVMAGAMNALGADHATKAKLPTFGYSSPSLSVDTERLMEAETGLPHAETSQSIVDVTITIKGSAERASFRVVQKQTSHFRYPS